MRMDSLPEKGGFFACDNLYVFGDSYCDVGNLFAATGGAVPSAPYYNGRFSNGLIWVDRVADFLGLRLEPSLRGGTDYAFGGAWVTASRPLIGEAFIPSVPQQVELYLNTYGGIASPTAVYVLEGGGNDILGINAGSPQDLAYEIATRIVECFVVLRDAGAKHFIVPNLFDMGLLPAAVGDEQFASAASAATNKLVSSLLALEHNLPEIQILRMDVFGLLSALRSDPTRFGFVDIETPCSTTTQCPDPERTFFWDQHHPTEFGHVCLAGALETALAQQL